VKKVLVIGEIGEDILSALSKVGFDVITAQDSEEGLRQLCQIHPNAVIMADSLPKVDGKELQARIRELCDLPIIVLGREKEELARAMKMESGADIYLNEGVRHPELIARLHSLLRRYRRRKGNPSLDAEGNAVKLQGLSAVHTPTEFRLFSCLGLNEGKIMPYSRLISEVWGQISLENLHPYVRRLKQKLGIGLVDPYRLLNYSGEGYCFVGNKR
jgi:DNA-binding response OmpR family regulator